MTAWRSALPRLSRFAVEHLLLLPLGALIALVWANVAPESYFRFVFAVDFAVNDVAMIFFFALITKEVVEATAPGGVLHPWQRALLPVVASIGATALPALIHVQVVEALEEPMLAEAWPVSMAVDLAATYFVARLIFRRHPIIPFLLLLGIASDAFGVLTVALVSPDIDVRLIGGALILAAAIAVALTLRRYRVKSFWPYLIAAGGLSWYAFFYSGLHPALALVPIMPFLPHAARDPGFFVDASAQARDTLSRFEVWWKYPAQIALFFFGLVNAGVPLSALEIGTWGLPIAVIVGKPVGVLAGAAVAVAVGLRLPSRVTWRELGLGGLIVAVGFSVGLFFTSALLPPGQLHSEMSMGVLLSLMAAPLAVVLAKITGVGKLDSGLKTIVAVAFAVTCLFPATAAAAGQNPAPPPATQPSSPTTGRVVSTITVNEGTVNVSGVDVELIALAGNIALAKTITDAAGQAGFPDVPAGRYIIRAARPGFESTDSPPFEVRSAETTNVLLDVRLTYVAESVEVRAPTSPTQSVQPVSASDVLSGSMLDIVPLPGDDFQSLLPLLPGIIRGPDGRLRAKGGQPTQGGLQISSTSLVDPSSGDFDLELPGASLESVELLPNPFAAEYGRFSTSVTQIRTRRGTNEWEVRPGNFVPRFGKGFAGIRGFEPRFSVRGPLKRNRIFIAQDIQFRYLNDPVKSLPDEPNITVRSFDSFTRVDGILSPRHRIGGLMVAFPREVQRLTMNTFRPPETTPDFNQSGTSMGVQDRFALSPRMVLQSTFAGRWFEINVNTDGREPMVYAPETERGSFYNDQERAVTSLQWIETLSVSVDKRGQHLLKFGLDFQNSSYDGTSTSRPVEIRRANGSLAELITPGATSAQQVSAAELALFAQDRWRIGERVTLEYGIRMDREDVIERVNWSPRGGVSIAVLPEGRAILRGGVGKFRQRTPLNVGAFAQFEDRVVTRYGADGEPLGPPLRLANVQSPDLRTPEAVTGNVEWNQRFGRRVLFKANYLKRTGDHEYILEPDASRGVVELLSTGQSRYWEFELTGRYLGGTRRDLTVSYVRSHGTADLNNYDQFYGNLRNPIVRQNENNLIPTDVPHRVIVRGTIGLPGQWDFAPVIEVRSGFPWSAVDEFQDFVGARNRAGRLPRVRAFDFSLSRPWRVSKYSFRAGVKIYNLLGASAQRDVQSNIGSAEFGQFFNPIERSIGFVFGSAK